MKSANTWFFPFKRRPGPDLAFVSCPHGPTEPCHRSSHKDRGRKTMLHSIISQQWENAAGREQSALSDGRDAAGRWWLSYRLKRCSIQLRGTIYGFRPQHLDQLTSNHSGPPQNSFPSDVPALSAYRIISCSGLTQSNVAAPRKPEPADCLGQDPLDPGTASILLSPLYNFLLASGFLHGLFEPRGQSPDVDLRRRFGASSTFAVLA